mgnify:CR=1 FL=1
MPIVPVFDPTTGASGGPSGGGGGSAGLPDWEAIDVTDGSWTSSDPGGNGRVSSVAVAGNDTTVTWNAFTPTADDMIDGANFNGQRYYRELTYPDGTAVSLSDTGWTIETWVNTPAVAGAALSQFALGISSSPTATSNTTMNFAGLYWTPYHSSGAARIGQIRTNASPLTASNLSNQYGYGRTAFVSGKGGLAFGWAIKSDGTSTGFNNRTVTNYAGTVYLQLSMGSQQTLAAGVSNVFSVYYRVIKTPIGPAGDAP